MKVPKAGREKKEQIVCVWNAISIDLASCTEPLHATNRMLNNDTKTGNNPVVLFLHIREWMQFRRFLWNERIWMSRLYTLETCIRKDRDVVGNDLCKPRFVREAFVMSSSRLRRCKYKDLFPIVDDQDGLSCKPFLFP